MAEDDPYIDLEDNSSNDAIKFVESANRLTMTALGSPPTTSPSYSKILEVLQDDERIPFVSQAGTSQSGGERILLNFWKDSKVSFKRVTTDC
jgi:prolyl oligopeptidase